MIILCTINDDICSAIHLSATFLAMLLTVILSYLLLIKRNLKRTTFHVFLLLLNANMVCIFTIGFQYMFYTLNLPFDCQFLWACYVAPVFSFGYHEWSLLLWLCIVDWASYSFFVNWLFGFFSNKSK